MTALGFIETKGLLAAVEAADAMIKAADVRLIEKNLVGGGLVTITVAGEVSAVRASVDAGVTAVKRLDPACLVSEHVIARAYQELARIIATQPAQTPPQDCPDDREMAESLGGECRPCPGPETGAAGDPAEDSEPVAKEPEKMPEQQQAPPTEEKPYPISGLKRMTVSKLRQIALGLAGISLTEQEIRTATKKKLIEAIVKATDR